MVIEALKGTKTAPANQLAQLKRHPGQSAFGIHAQQITTGLASQWKRQVLAGKPTIFESSTAKLTLTAEQREQNEAPLF